MPARRRCAVDGGLVVHARRCPSRLPCSGRRSDTADPETAASPEPLAMPEPAPEPSTSEPPHRASQYAGSRCHRRPRRDRDGARAASIGTRIATIGTASIGLGNERRRSGIDGCVVLRSRASAGASGHAGIDDRQRRRLACSGSRWLRRHRPALVAATTPSGGRATSAGSASAFGGGGATSMSTSSTVALLATGGSPRHQTDDDHRVQHADMATARSSHDAPVENGSDEKAD